MRPKPFHRPDNRRRRICLLTALLLIVAAPVHGASIEGVEFEDRVVVNDTTLALRGVDLLRYMVFIKAYAGALYLDKNIASDEVFSDVEKQLVLHYFHAISTADFARATSDMIAENGSSQSFAALRPRVKKMNFLYRDVTPGARSAGTRSASAGTVIARQYDIHRDRWCRSGQTMPETAR